MGENSSIEWCDHTFNPWIGCTRVSPGCQHCYAETMMDQRWGKVKWGPQGARVRTSEANWRKPLKWNRDAEMAGERRRVFCASLADVFEQKLDQKDELWSWRFDLWNLIEATPWLDWLLLTKRPENVVALSPYTYGGGLWPGNIWIGTSVENQEQADKRIPELLKIPAAVRFLSVEPLLGAVHIGDNDYSWLTCFDSRTADSPETDDYDCCESFAHHGEHYHGVDWVICGGESGPGARPMHPEWVRDIRDECQAADVPFLFKQWGEWAPYYSDKNGLIRLVHNDEPINLTQVSFVPPSGKMARVGKKKAERLLDGREWNEFPVGERA